MIIQDSFLVNIGESYIVAYLMSNEDNNSSENGQSGHIPFKLKLKIFPPHNLENPDVV